MTGTPGLTGLTEVGITTTGFDEHLRLYRDLLGFSVRAEGTIPAEVVEHLWGLPAGTPAQAVRLASGDGPSGFIRLLHFPTLPAPEMVRPGILDSAIFDFDIYAHDVPAAHLKLSAAGFPWTLEPQRWTADFLQGRDVVEGWCLAPDAVNLVMPRPFENKGSFVWEKDPAQPYSEMASSVYVTTEIEPEIRFWQALGLRIGADMHLKHPDMMRFLEAPDGAELRMLLMTAKGSGPARVEIIAPLNHPTQRNLIRRQRPGRMAGLGLWAIRVGDLDAALDAAKAGGGIVTATPIEIDTPIHGRARAAAVETPAGVLVELYQN